MHIFFSVGEPSGDQHAAGLIHEMQKRRGDLRLTGFGGPLMERAGCKLLFPLTSLAVMGFLGIVPMFFRFYRLVRQARKHLKRTRPDVVVLVDFPGFNWWIARAAKKQGIPVYYYMPPQLWAWAPWRIRKVRAFVDRVLCALPFEHEWYASRGIDAVYVGHPFFDEVAEYPLDRVLLRTLNSPEARTVGIFPGSRNHEVTRNFPIMLQIARRIAATHPNVRFLVACYKQAHRELCEQLLKEQQFALPIEFLVGKTPEVIELAECCLMVSGSLSLEMVARAKPAIVLYRVTWSTYVIGRMLIQCRFMSLPNLILDREIMPEFLSKGDPQPVIDRITTLLDIWLSDARELEARRQDFAQLRDQVARTGATNRAVSVILGEESQAALSRAA